MRALCGAIIAAGAMIGLGLTALGVGIRYARMPFGPETVNPNTHSMYGSTTLMLVLVVLLIALLIGLGISFLGLAFHHYRRHHEHLRDFAHLSEGHLSGGVRSVPSTPASVA